MAATGVVLDRIEQNLVALVQNLKLTGTPGTTPDVAGVYRQMLPEQLAVQFPCVLVTSFGERARDADEGGHTFETRGTAYPVRIMVLDAAGPYPQAREPDYLAWTHAIAQALDGLVNYPLLPDCPEVWWVELSDLTHVDPRLPESQWFRAGILATCHAAEPRARGGAFATA